ncbi:NUDIX domain-containing protein [Aerococcus urinaeequi]|uniref:NUDIX domain-containing protein n=1 Tax=Aerococcus urinaeequi TaxID=51665 RepID=UPI003AE897F9
MDLTLNTDIGKLNIRVAAWIESRNNILVSKFPSGIISLPGGRVKFSETTIEAIKREVLEETGEELYEIELFSIIENFFLEKQSNKDFHEFLFVYKGKIKKRKKYSGIDNSNQDIIWETLDVIKDLRPNILNQLVGYKNQSNIIHLINKD